MIEKIYWAMRVKLIELWIDRKSKLLEEEEVKLARQILDGLDIKLYDLWTISKLKLSPKEIEELINDIKRHG